MAKSVNVIGTSWRLCNLVSKTLTPYGVTVNRIHCRELTKEILYNVLALTENGFEDIVSRSSKYANEFAEICDSGTTSQAIEFLIKHPQVIKTCITYNDTQLLVGWDKDDIKMFLPREVKKIKLNTIREQVNINMDDIYSDEYEEKLRSEFSDL